ncbi:aldehyde dehydrogenase [Hyphococcus flavus]|uniref:Aldehyde dehydrogenase n=1 Tax=Hyphococcus flavus TaxID=1866326 RepID=A0AAF0CDR5_9PROT|nr:aldehyde dehydrogenase [Hyphococcus flavus]WDI30131.1 aldehyde dehydrogenase [Hyphococcus flavus]
MDFPLLVGGQEKPASNNAIFKRINAETDELISRAAAATIDDAVSAADAAQSAFSLWSSYGPNARREVLRKAAEIIDERKEDFVTQMMAETGATAPWAAFNCMLAANMFREAAAITTQINGDVIPSDRPGTISMAVREPAGVVLGIAPWNAPIILGARAIATPLACGNTVILKSSEVCPGVHYMIGKAVQDAGAPAGAINVISNAPEDAGKIVAALIEHAAVRRVNFTGSTRVGRIIAETCARALKPVLLELGGKAPLIVLDDADIDAAVDAAIFGGYANQGQICMSTERVIVDQTCADQFVEKLATRAVALPSGPNTEQVVISHMVDCKAVEHAKALVDDATEKGAALIAGGHANGLIMQATIVDNVTQNMRLYHEESFGPILSIIRVSDEDEAIRVANDSEYGLSSAVFGRDASRALAIARRVKSGICHVNGPTVHDEPQMPFGGVGASGYGRFGGAAGIDAFTERKWITINTEKPHYPF